MKLLRLPFFFSEVLNENCSHALILIPNFNYERITKANQSQQGFTPFPASCRGVRCLRRAYLEATISLRASMKVLFSSGVPTVTLNALFSSG